MSLAEIFRSYCGKSAAGFSLLEALVALALMALTLGGLGAVAHHWIPTWAHGFSRLSTEDKIAIAVQRLASDFAAAEFVPARPKSSDAFFNGQSEAATFVRTAISPNAIPGLEIVRILQVKEGDEFLILRSSAPYPEDETAPALPPTPLLRSRYRVRFDYAGANRVWQSQWQTQRGIPSAVRLVLADGDDKIVTAVSVHAQLPLECLSSKAAGDCLGLDTQGRQAGAKQVQ